MSRPTNDAERLSLITELLDEAYAHHSAHPDNDYYKFGEGSVTMRYPSTWDRRDGDAGLVVEIFSTAFSDPEGGQTGRRLIYTSIAEALAGVERIHAAELATDWDAVHAEADRRWGELD